MSDSRGSATLDTDRFEERYDLGAELGKGSSGRVVRATRRADGYAVAIKFFAGEASGIPEARTRFLAEAKVAAGIDSPNVVPVLEVGEYRGSPFIVMELLEGQDLEGRMRGADPPGYRHLLEIFAGVARGLADLHAAGVVHRDLKPENLLVDRSGHAWVVDLGLAKSLAVDQVQTQTGILLGTPGYLAPEALSSEAVGPPADVFTLGLVLYRCFAGREPFPQPDPSDRLRAQLREGAPDGDALPREVADLYDAMVAAEPARRPSAQEVESRLMSLSVQEPSGEFGGVRSPSQEIRGSGLSGAGLRETQRSRRPRSLPLVPLGAATALVLGGAWLAFVPDPGPRAAVVGGPAIHWSDGLEDAARFDAERFLGGLVDAVSEPPRSLEVEEWRSELRARYRQGLKDWKVVAAHRRLAAAPADWWRGVDPSAVARADRLTFQVARLRALERYMDEATPLAPDYPANQGLRVYAEGPGHAIAPSEERLLGACRVLMPQADVTVLSLEQMSYKPELDTACKSWDETSLERAQVSHRWSGGAARVRVWARSIDRELGLVVRLRSGDRAPLEVLIPGKSYATPVDDPYQVVRWTIELDAGRMPAGPGRIDFRVVGLAGALVRPPKAWMVLAAVLVEPGPPSP